MRILIESTGRIPFIWITVFIISLFLSPFSSLSGQNEIEIAVPAPKGIIIFAGMDLAGGEKVASYSVERSLDKKRWEKIAEWASPQDWDAFYANVNRWKDDFGFQGFPETDDLKVLWQKCETAGVIDSMGYWAASTLIRLAAGIAWYDQTAMENTSTWYRTRALGKGGTVVSEYHSMAVQYPYIPVFDEVSLAEKNVDKTLFYLKWQSKGDFPAPYFSVRYYENDELKKAGGSFAAYQVGDMKYYLYQDSTRYLKSERQYFMNQEDFYGNKAVASDRVLVSSASLEKGFFIHTRAESDPKGLGVVLHWKIENATLAENIRIYRSDLFDGKPYEELASIPVADTSYIDRSVVPDRMYFYYLVGENRLHHESFQSNVFFNAGYDKLKPAPPSISQGKMVPGGVEIAIRANDNHLSGFRVYRSDGNTVKLYPISGLLKMTGDLVVYEDTSKVLAGDRSYLYAATAVSTSSVESDFSDTLTIRPSIKTTPPSPNRISAYEEDRTVKIIWEDVRTRHRATNGYHIYRRELPDGKFTTLLSEEETVPDPVFTDSTARPEKGYEYAVQTVDDLGGTSESMALYSIYVKKIVLPVPPDVWVTQSEGKVTVQWNEPSSNQPLKVNLYRYQRGENPQLLKSFSLAEQQFTDTKVKKGELYFYFTTHSDDDNNESFRSKETGIRME
ncbi:hypothetical protein [Proteiniphilum sp.]|uniref:fibronectin type III domain-containing protein n=1 Tax=Proteiniphilum sp. TaxID=1926877 RepID=UPI002B1F6E72|nr:hypothetical protein [Proteiniphilum sp.]MEA4918703.1 hypothetical protein [Proteiniphilum sp.]